MSKNAPPPLLPSLLGKPQTFAMPTAEPTDAKINPQRLAKFLVFFIVSPISEKTAAQALEARAVISLFLFKFDTQDAQCLALPVPVIYTF